MIKLSDKNIAILAVIIAILVNGAGPVLTKIALHKFSPEYFSFLRFLISSIVMLPLFLRLKIKLDRDLLKLVLISLLSTLNILLFAHGVKLTTATVAQVLYVLGPIIITIFSYFLIKEKITSKKISGILLGLIGASLIILMPVISKNAPFTGDLKGNIIILFGVLSYSLYTVLTKKFHSKFSPLQIVMVFSLTTMFTMLILSFSQIIKEPDLIFKVPQNILFSVFYVGAVSTAISYLMFQYAVKHGSPLIASITLYLNPFSTIIWASYLIGERLTSLLLIGAAFVLSGAYLIFRSHKNAEIDIEA